MRIKICCIQSLEEARMAALAGANMLGLVGRMPSGPGPIEDDAIAEIAAAAPRGTTTVLLSSETGADALVDHARRTGVDALQIVDAPKPGAYEELRRASPGLRIIQVIHVEDERAIEEARRLDGLVDVILLDSGRPSAPVKELGGTGRTHDWRLSARLVEAVSTPVLLAGGLSPANAAEAIRAVGPAGLDICSGVRTDGALDPGKLSAFIAAAKGV